MPKFPEPPAAERLAEVPPEIHPVPPGSLLWRIYFRGGEHAGHWSGFRTFGPTNARFDHHLPDPDGEPAAQERGILYTAASGVTCLAEVFQDTRIIDRWRADPWLAGFEAAAELRLLDVTGIWTTRAGASDVINSGPRPRARRWARAIYDAYPDLDGIWYRSSMHAPNSAQALFERAANRGGVPSVPEFHRALHDPGLLEPLRRAANRLNYGLV